MIVSEGARNDIEAIGKEADSLPPLLRERLGRIFESIGNTTAVARLSAGDVITPDDVGTFFDGAAMMKGYFPYDRKSEEFRHLESPEMLEARLERYVSDKMGRKVLKSFARDFCEQARTAWPAMRANRDSQITAYETVFNRFSLREAATSIKEIMK